MFEGQVSKSSSYQVANQLFPGELDRGTPVIIKENDRYTVIGDTTTANVNQILNTCHYSGMFREHLNQRPWSGKEGPSMFDRLHPEQVNSTVHTI